MLPAIFGLQGLQLTDNECDFFRASQPMGFILFGRNIESKRQVAALTASLRETLGRDNLPILIDQEGGRVARLTAPEWPSFPPAACFATAWEQDPQAAIRATELNYEALGLELAALGISVDCAPVLDIPQPGAHDIIGDRAFGSDPATVARLGRAALDGLARAGVVGVIKHIPGHGRAMADSHHDLPRVTADDAALALDLAPFTALADAPMAMTAHILYEAWDAEHCATLSKTIIRSIIRERIGFSGLLMSDDLDMKALRGSVPELALAALNAGCDVALNCWGKMSDMQGMAELLPEATVSARHRLAEAMAAAQPLGESVDMSKRQEALVADRDSLLKSVNDGAV